MPEAVGRWLGGRRPWSVGVMAMAAVGAIAWLAGLPTWQLLAVGLAAMSIGVLVASLPRRIRGASPAPVTARVPSPAGDVDPDEVIMQDVNSGRIWRLGDVHFLSAAEKRRLAAERPLVWKTYRARVFPFPELQRVNHEPAPCPAAPPPGCE